MRRHKHIKALILHLVSEISTVSDGTGGEVDAHAIRVGFTFIFVPKVVENPRDRLKVLSHVFYMLVSNRKNVVGHDTKNKFKMKKIVLMLSIVFVCGVVTIDATPVEMKVAERALTNGNYERVRSVSVVSISGPGSCSSVTLSLYKGVNTCDEYYLHDGFNYLAVRKNNQSSYKGNDVSGYMWVAYSSCGSSLFFNF